MMKEKLKKWSRPALFTVSGMLVGLVYYNFIGCAGGSCPLSSNPLITMIYLGVVGWLLSGIFAKE